MEHVPAELVRMVWMACRDAGPGSPKSVTLKLLFGEI
jgi:hypothetical protein